MPRLSRSSAALVLGFVSALSVVTLAQSMAPVWKPYTTPKTPWGDPDIQGVWSNSNEINVPFERPAEFGTREYLNKDEVERVLAARNKDREDNVDNVGGIGTGAGPGYWYEYWTNNVSLRTSIVVDPPDGRIPPLTAEAKRRADELARLGRRGSWGKGPWDGPEDFSNYERCITRGLPDVNLQLFYNNNYQIVQGPGYVAILYEMIHESRVIPLDGRPHSPVPQIMGDSRGRWEGQTLVVDVRNFSDKTNFRGSGSSLHLVERFTRISPTEIEYEVTMDDPTVWTKPWTARSFWKKDAKQAQVLEYACHEGNYGMFNMLSGSRAAEKKAAEAGKK